jgi:hypothetical protein
MNANGVWDGRGTAEAEPALSEWTIELFEFIDATTWNSVASTTTASDGSYTFNTLIPDVDYVVCEVLENGWHQSYPTLALGPPTAEIVDCAAVLGAGYGQYGYKINLDSEEVDNENNFGNYEDIGCSLTQGYWKTHADPLNIKKYDDTWDEVGGPSAPFFDTGQSWIVVFNTPPSGGNAYYILAHQYMAAILNSLKDEDPASLASIASEMAQATALLDFYDTYPGGPYIPADGTEFSPNDRELAISIAEILDQFNNGDLPGGPPHCDD